MIGTQSIRLELGLSCTGQVIRRGSKLLEIMGYEDTCLNATLQILIHARNGNLCKSDLQRHQPYTALRAKVANWSERNSES